jgi:AsmA protein
MLAAAATQEESTPQPPAAPPKAEAPATDLPMALTVKQITVSKARLMVTDDLGKLPQIKGETDAVIGVDLTGGLASLQLNGDLNFKVDVVYQQLTPHVEGTAHFDKQQITFNVNADLENEKVQLTGSAADYLAAPDIKLDILSKKLDLDHLLGLMAGLAQPVSKADKTEKKSASKASPPATAPAAGFPPGLKAQGKIAVDQSVYKALAIDNLLLRYSLVDGILKLTDVGADIADGKLTSKATIDLNKPGLAYDGQLQIAKVKIERLVAGITETDFNQLSGQLQTAFTFKGQGLAWSRISKTLQAKGDYGLLAGQIRETPVTKAMADLLKLEDLRKFSFEKIVGNLLIKDGRLLLNSVMDSKDITAESQGSIGLDGTMNLPINLKLSAEMSRKLQKNLSIAKYLSSEKGETELNFKVGGTVQHPKAALDEVAMKNVVIDIGATELNKLLSDHKDKKTTAKDSGTGETKDKEEDVGRQLLKGLLGK